MLGNISFPIIVKEWNMLPREVVDAPKMHLENNVF